MADDDHEHDHDEEHEHGTLHFERSEVAQPTLTVIAALHPALADVLILAQRFDKLTEAEKADLASKQEAVEACVTWTPGFWAAGDMCAVCESPAPAIFEDRLVEGTLAYGAFIDDVPVHLRKDCIAGFAKKAPRRAPQTIDKLRRQYTRDRQARPSARLTQFFRYDLLSRPPFSLEDWANSVADANAEKMGRSDARDIERLIQWVHKRLFH
ncbi:MAG: hypothetical protein WDA16_10260 [Candidatus Thermoplasmatota archaeon]